jgi:hypothetical protein
MTDKSRAAIPVNIHIITSMFLLLNSISSFY